MESATEQSLPIIRVFLNGEYAAEDIGEQIGCLSLFTRAQIRPPSCRGPMVQVV